MKSNNFLTKRLNYENASRGINNNANYMLNQITIF